MDEQKFVDVEALEITISQSIDEYWNGKNGYYLAEDALKEINHFPIADVVPVVHGRWETNSDRPDSLICSVCKCGFDMWKHDPHNYCPNCGAKMYEKENDK